MAGHLVSSRPGAIGLVLATSLTLAVSATAYAGPTVPVQPPAGSPEVTVTELPPLPPLPGGEPVSGVPLVYDVNGRGQVVGTSGGRAALWDGGEPTELPGAVARRVNDRGDVLLSASSGEYRWYQGELTQLPADVIGVDDLNESGQVLVQTSSTGPGVWADGTLTEIDVAPAPPRPGYGGATLFTSNLSDAGHVALTWMRCRPGGWPFQCYVEPPVVWQDGRVVTRLGEESRPLVVNDSGQVITTQGTVWTDGQATDLGGMQPTNLNNRGQVVGSIAVDGQRHAALWEDGRVTDLGALGDGNSEATEINELGHVIGTSDGTDGQTQAVLWVDGHIVDLGFNPPFAPTPFALADGGGYVTGTIGPSPQDPKARLWQVHGGGASGDPLEPACFAATNAAHVEAGRAVSWLVFSWAAGSNQYLGTTYQTTTLRESSPGRWELADSC